MTIQIAENTTTAPIRATRREWIGLGVIALPCLLYSMDLTVLNLAVPALSAALKPSAAEQLWIIDVYGFLVAGSLITMGTLGDRIGRRRLLLIGAAAFGLGSILAAFATSAPLLIAARAVLGLAGATLAPSTLSLIRNMFLDAEQRTFAIGIWISSYSAGAAIGPLVGGIVLEYFWWGSVFLIGVPIMVLLLIAGPRLLPEYRDPNAGRLDLLSAALSLAAMLSVIYGLKQIAQDGLATPPVLVVVAGGVFGWMFVRRQKRLADPLIDVGLFRAPAFSAALGTYTVATFVAFGVYVFVAQYMQLVLGMSPLRAGLATVPFALTFIVGSMLTPALVRRFTSRRVIAGGLIVAACSFVMLASVDRSTGLPFLVMGFTVYSAGLAPVFTLATDIIVGAAPPERAGAASAISESGSELGGALGIAILGSAGTAIYRAAMTRVAIPNVSLEEVEAARSTLGGAAAVAARLPASSGEELVRVAQGAFIDAVQLTCIVSAVLSVATAIVVALVLRADGSGTLERIKVAHR